jgi:hypothetical protein
MPQQGSQQLTPMLAAEACACAFNPACCSDALIGGGFQFNNPNAADSCGCGKSFGV